MSDHGIVRIESGRGESDLWASTTSFVDAHFLSSHDLHRSPAFTGPLYLSHSALIMSSDYSPLSPTASHEARDLSHAAAAAASDANIRNFAPVARIMKTALPDNAKIAKEAKECMQECVSEFISFITSEGKSPSSTLAAHRALTWLSSCLTASEKCQQEKRKTVNGEDILFAMTSLGFENYAEALKIYLSKYREVSFVWPILSISSVILTKHISEQLN